MGKRVNFAQIEFEIAILERKLPTQKGLLSYHCMDLPHMPEKMSEEIHLQKVVMTCQCNKFLTDLKRV